MNDSDIRAAEARAQRSGGIVDVLGHRAMLKRAGASADLDLSIPHKYVLVSGDPTYHNPQGYGLDLAALRTGCADDPLQPFFNGRARPFTFAENLRTRLEADMLDVWVNHVRSCTGVLYEGTPGVGTRFKIVQISDDLLGLRSDMRYPLHKINFDSIEGEVFRSSEVSCNRALTMTEARNHPAWLAAAGYNQKLLDDYVERAYQKSRQTNDGFGYFMDFCIRDMRRNGLRPLVLGARGNSVADAADFLYDSSKFVRIIPQ